MSAILDLYDRRIVSFVVRDSNNNALVFDTFDEAIEKNPNAHPLCHSDRGYQYTNRLFHSKLEKAGMTQSMSRVGKCIDNGPMERFWGILKRERYYGKRFTDKETLVKMIEDYIDYYNSKHLQRNLGVLTPMEKHEIYLQAAQKLPADNLLAGKILYFFNCLLDGEQFTSPIGYVSLLYSVLIWMQDFLYLFHISSVGENNRHYAECIKQPC